MGTRSELRADAARNRDAILASARAVFGEQGLDAPIDEIARRSGVGSATLYRRFPCRSQLVAAVFEDRMRVHVETVEAALEQPDAWEAFRSYILTVCRMQATDRGLADLITMRVGPAPEIEELRARAYAGFIELAERAKAAGELRADFEPEDLGILLLANAGLVHRAHGVAEEASERLAHLLLDGYRAVAGTPAPPPPARQLLIDAMVQQTPAAGCGSAGADADLSEN
jgi:AcrR family transcriptional regulator